MKLKPREKIIKKSILEWLGGQPETFAFVVTTTGIPDFKRRGGFRRNPNAGISDILGVKGGKFFALEVKSPGREATARQRNFLRRAGEAGGYAAIVFSLDDAQKCWWEI